MRKLLLIVFVMIAYLGKSQITGVKFVPDNTHWSTAAGFQTGLTTYTNVACNIYVKGDTIINSKYCQKVFISNYSLFDTTCLRFHGYTYYDNRRLYTDTAFIGNGTLQYNFNLVVGDTFNVLIVDTIGCNGYHSYFNMTVDTVDSMNYGNKWRKRIIFKKVPGLSFGRVRWVEGIGDLDYGLGIGNDPYNFGWGFRQTSVYGFIDHCFCDYGYARLNCFQEPAYNTYGAHCTTGSCVASISSNYISHNVHVYPNPATDIINIKSSLELGTIIIYNTIGEVMLQTQSKNKTEQLDISNLENGIYFIQLKTSGGIATKKIIVHH